jgi:hypothetical protein
MRDKPLPDVALRAHPGYDFLGPEGRSVALFGQVAKIGNGGTVTNGQVLTVTPQGNVLTTVTRDTAVSISEDGRVRGDPSAAHMTKGTRAAPETRGEIRCAAL